MPTVSEKHLAEAALLAKHVEHFKTLSDDARAEAFAAEAAHTLVRAAFARKAEELVSKLGLKDEVTATTVTATDAVNFVAKVLHEDAHGVKTSHFQRANRHAAQVDSGKFVDAAKMVAPRDSAADVVEHLGLTDEKHIASVKALFAPKGA
jgi:hypothetical protein